MSIEWKPGSLEPQNWDEFAQYGQQILADLFRYLEHVDQEKVWKPIGKNTLNRINEPAPIAPQGLEQSYTDFFETILPAHSPMNVHPRFWGWIMGCGNPVGVLAEMLAAGLNANVIGGTQLSCKIEELVLDWLKQVVEFPSTASGILTSGCSMANLIALTTARNQANQTIRQQGLGALSQPLVLYTSQERHHSIDKAVEILGLGREQLRLVPTDDQFRMCLRELASAIEQDRARGLQPFCIVATAGTTNTGAVDDLAALADLAAQQQIWLHVDGAFGALAVLSAETKPLLNGLSRADSLAFDLHKWMYLPYGVGCVLIQDQAAHLAAFAADADYIAHKEPWFSDYGIELSRGFLALKVWMCLKTYGLAHFGQLIAKDIQHARYLADAIKRAPALELLAPVSLNIVCFRYVGSGQTEAQLDTINKRIVMFLQFEGRLFPSETIVDRTYAIRVSITNYKSQPSDFDALVERVVQLGHKLTS